jgi:hypothetical protein
VWCRAEVFASPATRIRNPTNLGKASSQEPNGGCSEARECRSVIKENSKLQHLGDEIKES